MKIFAQVVHLHWAVIASPKELVAAVVAKFAGWPLARHLVLLPPLHLLPLPRRPHLQLTVPLANLETPVPMALTAALEPALGANLAPVRAWRDFDVTDTHLGNIQERSTIQLNGVPKDETYLSC